MHRAAGGAHNQPLAADSHPHADLAARVGKAAGVDTAVRAVADLAPLIGAVGFQRAHPIAKARADLTRLLYADGIHDPPLPLRRRHDVS